MNTTIFLPSDINSTVKAVKSRFKNVFNHFSPVKVVVVLFVCVCVCVCVVFVLVFGVNFYFNELNENSNEQTIN